MTGLEKLRTLNATPEQVWEAIATGPGVSTWFVPATVDPVIGGAVQHVFGPGYVTTGRITELMPGKRLVITDFDGAEGDDQPNYAYEFLIEGRDGGSTVLRFVQSGFLDGDDWEAEYDSMSKGWDMYFDTLVAYFEHFGGLPVRNVAVMTMTQIPADQAWDVLHQALGLTARPSVGDHVLLTPSGVDPIDGVVDIDTPEFLGVRSAIGLHRFGAEGPGTCGVSTYHYLYGPDAPDLDMAYQKWLGGLFPAN